MFDFNLINKLSAWVYGKDIVPSKVYQIYHEDRVVSFNSSEEEGEGGSDSDEVLPEGVHRLVLEFNRPVSVSVVKSLSSGDKKFDHIEENVSQLVLDYAIIGLNDPERPYIDYVAIPYIEEVEYPEVFTSYNDYQQFLSNNIPEFFDYCLVADSGHSDDYETPIPPMSAGEGYSYAGNSRSDVEYLSDYVSGNYVNIIDREVVKLKTYFVPSESLERTDSPEITIKYGRTVEDFSITDETTLTVDFTSEYSVIVQIANAIARIKDGLITIDVATDEVLSKESDALYINLPADYLKSTIKSGDTLFVAYSRMI